ncbi:hypothetical protein RRG08_000275 [Elysia crispata]|uniref:Uncharacterized protein n=1 Tax=Elysia crispata TaxID=231223 RepID=A0AAE1B5Q0_9GAST|nr:hypothetical protein RRG08_000275 [Elysia crispata]
MDDLNCGLRYGFICETYAACTNNTFGANCLEKCSPNCGGLNNACDNFNGFCFNGCDDGYLGKRCGAPCTKNTFGANCTEICNTNCGGPQHACNNVNGFCLYGCVEGYHGERCDIKSDKTPFVFNFLAFIIGYTLGLLLLTCIIVALGPKSQSEDKDAENGLEAGEEMDNLFDLPVINNLSEPEYSNTESIYDV